MRIRDLAETLHELLGCEVELAGGAEADPRSYRVDFSKLRTSFPEFRCEWNAVSGAAELTEAYASVGLTYEEFIDVGRYTRLAQLRRLLEGARLDDDLRWRS